MALFSRQASPDPDDDDFDPAPKPASPAAGDLRPIRLRDWEIPVGYLVAAFVVLLAVLELVITKGKGAPKTPDTLLPVVALIIGVAQAATISLKNRLVTGILGVLGGLAVAYVRVPDSLSIPHSIGFIGPFVYAFLITQRHSRAQRALQGPRRPRQGGGGSGARGGSGSGSGRRGSKAPIEPTGIKASRRYTPPKPKEERTRRR